MLDNELAQFAMGSELRVCGRCEAQTYYTHCPDCCDDEGKPIELHEGHLTNMVAQLRATGRAEGVEDVFKLLERENPVRPIGDDQVRWEPDVAMKKAREKKERDMRQAIAEAHRG